jgi:hypothetical protein
VASVALSHSTTTTCTCPPAIRNRRAQDTVLLQARHHADTHAFSPRQHTGMFFFFSNKLGWAGSIAVSVVLSLLVYALFRFVF